MKVEIHPLNPKGKYYIDQNTCTCCAVCEDTAPDFFTDNNGYHVAKQPQNAEEEALCEEATASCPVEAIHDDGD